MRHEARPSAKAQLYPDVAGSCLGGMAKTVYSLCRGAGDAALAGGFWGWGGYVVSRKERMDRALFILTQPVPSTKGMAPKDRALRLHAELERRIAIAKEGRAWLEGDHEDE
jgi:hypothetical protein